MANLNPENPPEADPPADVKPTTDDITNNLFEALTGDESLTDEDRRKITEGLNEKTGGKPGKVVTPEADHWTKRKLW